MDAHRLFNCQTGNNRLRAGLPKAWRVGNKTGNNGKDAAGDIAVVWSTSGARIVICAYTRDGSPSAAQIEAVFKEAAPVAAAQCQRLSR
jgi:beta-lactamase class A